MTNQRKMTNEDDLRIALAQIAPVLLDRSDTLEKVVQRIGEAAAEFRDR